MRFLTKMVLLRFLIIEMTENAFLYILRLSGIDYLVFLVFEKIDSSFFGQFVNLFGRQMGRERGLFGAWVQKGIHCAEIFIQRKQALKENNGSIHITLRAVTV